MTFLILLLAFAAGSVVGVFLFGQGLKLRKDRTAAETVKLVLWVVIALVCAFFVLLIYPYADLGYGAGLLFGLACCLYTPGEKKDDGESKV